MRARVVQAAWELAREKGLAGFTLKDLGERVGVRAPSLFVYFDGKDAVYDEMFAQGWREWSEYRAARRFPSRSRPRARVRAWVRAYCHFFLADPVRFQLLNQRVVPGFEPTPRAYAGAVADWEAAHEEVSALGVQDAVAALDLLTAMSAGLISQQIANDPGGRRWSRRAGEVADMWCDHHGIE